MRLSFVIIFAAFVLSATAFPIDGYISRSNSIRRRADHIGGQASQGLHGSDTDSEPPEIKFSDGTTINRNPMLQAKSIRVRLRSAHWLRFIPAPSADPSEHPGHDGTYRECKLHQNILVVRDFYDTHGGILLSQVKFSFPFAQAYIQKLALHHPAYMNLEFGQWMASYPEVSTHIRSFTFKEDGPSNGKIRHYVDPSGVPMMSIKEMHDGTWEVA